MKKCLYCGEMLDDDVTKCLFCGKPLMETATRKIKWYHRTTSLVVGFLVMGPFILPAVWSNPRFSSKTKFFITAVTLALTYYLFVVTCKAFKGYLETYQQILNVTK